ncbi:MULTISPECIES: trigger factor [Oceanimonas]|uniref:Trigger factor n=1 Tax=Oceanimonas doudoroffii TaxID=84158 RepID=A0A233RFW6_9GAMM|nr:MULTISPECIES: trigger factor [Oceanimonas]NHI01806.1 Trigger factor [Oceanimonas sp. MB9]OXY82287.1 trigger factor [Oceanimonas doudoroffii]
MQVSVETTQGLERRLTITVPAEQVTGEVNSRLRQLAKTRRIDGFRPGKAPLTVIKKMFGASVEADVAGELMQRNFFEAVMSEKLNPAGMPAMEPTPIKAGEDFTFTATFEVYPEVEVKGLDAVSVEKPQAEVTDADLDNMIDTLRKQHADWTEADRAAEDGDRVTMNFVGSVDGEEFEGGKAEDFVLVLGSGRMIPGFEDGLLGKKAGDEFTIEVTFPEEYHAENLKGKPASFAITLTKVEAQQLPELTEEFVKRFGIADGTVDGLKAEVRKNMERELAQALKASVKEQVIDGLLEQNEIDVPQSLIDGEVDTLRKQALQRFGGMDAKNAPQLPAELFKDQAERRVRVGLLLGELIKTNEIKADDAKVQEIIASMASAYEDPTEVVAYYNDNPQLLENVRSLAVEDQAVEFVLSQAKVTDKQVSFDDVMNKPGVGA